MQEEYVIQRMGFINNIKLNCIYRKENKENYSKIVMNFSEKSKDKNSLSLFNSICEKAAFCE